MDFVDWCHRVLQTLENERFSPHLGDHELQNIIFGEAAHEPEFHTSNARHGMFHALNAPSKAELAEEVHYNWKPTPLGRQVLADSISYWSGICEQELDAEEETLLRAACEQSPQEGSHPEHSWLMDVERDAILAAFNIPSPPPQTNEHMDQLQKYLYQLPGLLSDRGFLEVRGSAGYQSDITPTYQGMVWVTRRAFTIDSKFIDQLVEEWETTNIEFKRALSLDTKGQKGEFAKDVLGLATTKSSGRRYMIVGFDDKTRGYHGPPDSNVNQGRMEQILADLTDPVVSVQYAVIDHQRGAVGKLEVIREPEKIPYRASKDVYDDTGRKRLEKGKVYVRHGSQTEAPTDRELEALEEEGQRARGERRDDPT